MCRSKQITKFSLEGRFLGFEFEDGYKLKRLRLATAEGEYSIKLAKPLRAWIDRALIPGTWVRVAGEKKLKEKTGEVKFKAYELEAAVTSGDRPFASVPVAVETPVAAAKAQPKATILVCQKSDCCKLGGREVCQAIEGMLRDRGLEDRVTLKGTGCLKQCKAGPNIVMMPDKTRYSRVHPSEIPALIDKHFPCDRPSENLTPELACQRC